MRDASPTDGLREALAVILSSAGVLRRRASDDTVAKHAERIRAQVERAVSLIEALEQRG